MHAAARQFARKAYSSVSLDEILAEAQVTKGAMYFHFRSKHALALAIIDQRAAMSRSAVNDLRARKLSGLETLIEFLYLIAAQDYSTDEGRAGVHLLESVGPVEGLQPRLFAEWNTGFARMVARAQSEDDIRAELDPGDVGRLVMSLYAGTRQISDVDDAEPFLRNLQKALTMTLPSVANPDRVSYFTQFITRRTALAINKLGTQQDPA
jgi:TetR/AcrR family transcriptional repressor of nem operon